jgi:hypothetical protein
MPETVRLKERTSVIYEKIANLTGMSYSEIARRSAEHYLGTAPDLSASDKSLLTDGIAGKKEDMPCLNCGKPVSVEICSMEHVGIFNVFCRKNGECEDTYAQKQ